MNARSLRLTLAKIALLCVSLGVALVIGEIVLRMMGYAAIYEMYSNPELLWQHDELLGWSQKPSSEAVYVGPRPWPVEFESRVAINSLGLRGPEPTPLPDGGVRILFLGDSMVAGFEVEYDETFCALLAKLLTERLHRPVQVINGGVRGYGTDQSYLYFKERGRLHRPDVVLYWLSENDLLDDITIHRMRRVFGKSAFVEGKSGELELVASPVPLYPECSEYRIEPGTGMVRIDTLPGRTLCRVQLALFDRSALFSFLTMMLTSDRFGTLIRDLYYLGMPSPNLQPGENRGASAPPITAHIHRSLAEEVRSSGAWFGLVAPPRVFEVFAESGVATDPATSLQLDAVEAADPKQVQFKHDSHYTAAGHRMVAEQLAELLVPIVPAPAPAVVH